MRDGCLREEERIETKLEQAGFQWRGGEVGAGEIGEESAQALLGIAARGRGPFRGTGNFDWRDRRAEVCGSLHAGRQIAIRRGGNDGHGHARRKRREVALALERIGRQRNARGAGAELGPIERRTREPKVTERRGDRFGLGSFLSNGVGELVRAGCARDAGGRVG